MNAAASAAQALPETINSQVLVVRVNGLLACIDLAAVERTFSLVELQAVPGAAPWVAGIMNYAGRSLAVLDMAMRLGMPPQPYCIETPIVVCAWQNHRVGLIVSDIVGNQTPAPADMQLADSFKQQGAAFRASVHTQMGLAFLLDTDWLVNASLYDSHSPSEPLRPFGGDAMSPGEN